MNIYLAGGMRSGWQSAVIGAVNKVVWSDDVRFFDPRKHGLERDPGLYTMWDLQRVKDSDLVFVYLEKDNPGAFGLGIEAGYAFGLGTPILLVDELPENKRFGMLRSIASATAADLDDGILALISMARPDQ